MSLHQSIHNVRALGLVCVKTAKNSGIQSNYASYADVWDTLRQPLADNGLSVGFLPGSARKDAEAWVQTLTLVVSDGSESLTVPFEILLPEGNRGVNLSQRQGMSHTYGRRYALTDFFHVITGDDDDAHRLGQPEAVDRAPQAADDAHWSQFCWAFDAGAEETLGAWALLVDPGGDGHSTLGDLSDGARAKRSSQFPQDPGLNAWRAELVATRASTKGMDWEEVRQANKDLSLPVWFRQCSPEQLVNLGFKLK